MGTFGNSSKDKERMLRDQASYRKKLEKKRLKSERTTRIIKKHGNFRRSIRDCRRI